MSRIVNVVLILTLALAGCRSLRVNPAPGIAADDWITEGDSPQRVYRAEQPLLPPLEQVWDYNANAGFGHASPIIWDDMVIVANRKGEVRIIDLDDGDKRGTKSFGEAIEGSLGLMADGLLFIPGAWGKRALYAYDLERARTLWEYKGPPVEAGLLALDDRLIVADVEGTVRAFEPWRGEVLWEYSVGDEAHGIFAAPVLSTRGHVIVADDKGQVVALEPKTGAVAWEARINLPVYRSPAALDGRLFIPTTRGRLVALHDDTGQEAWTYTLPDTTVRFTAPTVDQRAVIAGTSAGLLVRLDPASGASVWTVPVGEAIAAPPLLASGLVYVGGMDRKLYAVRVETGEVVWSTDELAGRIKSPMAARDGKLVVLTEPRTVYLFTTDEEAYAKAD